MATAVGPHIFWITSRAAGSAALVLSSLAVCAGLLMGGHLVKGRGPDLRVTHEGLSLATIAAIFVHAVALFFDGFLRPSLIDLSIPFASGYKEPWMAVGIVAGWALILLGLSFYCRSFIGHSRWRKLHRFTALAWILGIAHSLGQGTDSGQAWFLTMTAIVAMPALALIARRWRAARLSPRVAVEVTS